MLFTKTPRLISGLLAVALINAAERPSWQSPARLHRDLTRGDPGTLRVDSQGVEFLPLKGPSERWTFPEIRDLDLGRRRVILTGYDNRAWHVPGTRRFDFDLATELTPAVAAALANEVGRPVRNRIPDPKAPAIRVIAVRQSELFGGSNGLLRIRERGIDYITAQPGQSRSWRWKDLQTLSNPDPYHLFVFGYRDSYAFDLKETLSRDVFNHLSDEIWTHNESDMRNGPMDLPLGTPYEQ